MTDLIVVASERDADIICVSETHFGEDYVDAELSIPNYNMFRADRNVNGGGAIIYANIRLSAVRLESFVVRDCVGISFETVKEIIHVVCVYRSTALTEVKINHCLLS